MAERVRALPPPRVRADRKKKGARPEYRVNLGLFIPDYYARSTVPLRVEDIYAVLGVFDDFTGLIRNHGDWVQRYVETRILGWRDGNARRRMAALRICRFLRDTTCDPTYAACRRRLVVAVAVAEAEEDMGL